MQQTDFFQDYADTESTAGPTPSVPCPGTLEARMLGRMARGGSLSQSEVLGETWRLAAVVYSLKAGGWSIENASPKGSPALYRLSPESRSTFFEIVGRG